jgi:RNA polymerase sigma-70 factor (ECF subfamily)
MMMAAFMTPRVVPPPVALPPEEDWSALRLIVRAVVARTLNVPVSHADVEDCASETMRRAIEGRARLKEGEPLRPWVIGIARHVALDAIRARKRQRDRHVEPAPDSSSSVVDVADRIPDSKPGPFERVASARDAQTVRAALAKLPDGARRALELFHVEGLTYPEIAKEMGVPLGTVATWILRGRKALAAEVTNEH